MGILDLMNTGGVGYAQEHSQLVHIKEMDIKYMALHTDGVVGVAVGH